MQEENPNMDLSQLFESEYTDRARREMHKRAFHNYKDFEFLKAGVLTRKEE